MSVKISGQVWELDLDPVDKLVLLALADHADHDGNNVRPGNKLLIEKTGLSQPTISSKIKKFIEDGILDPQNGEDPGRGGARAFTLDVSSIQRRGYFIEREEQKRVKAASRFNGNSIKAGYTFSAENIKTDDKNIKADNGNIKADKSSHDKERARVEPSEPSIESSWGEETLPVLDVSAIWRDVFSEPLGIHRQTVLESESITCEETFRSVLAIWRTNGYSTRNLTGIASRYKEELAKKSSVSANSSLSIAPLEIPPGLTPGETKRFIEAHVAQQRAA